ncbi:MULTISPECIES: hypothetical protein [unclassified Thiocapsa]|uniref:hypothetical protein n=1 Tax=unclassified Thiocapsa TaxID=2641286 RepID=UPI0035AF938E
MYSVARRHAAPKMHPLGRRTDHIEQEGGQRGNQYENGEAFGIARTLDLIALVVIEAVHVPEAFFDLHELTINPHNRLDCKTAELECGEKQAGLALVPGGFEILRERATP